MITEFQNEPFTDFSVKANEDAMNAALKLVRSKLGQDYPLHINGQAVETEKKLSSTNPSNPSEIVGNFSQASVKEADDAMSAAVTAFETWKTVCPQKRARHLFKAAAIMRRRKFEFSAWLVVEIGKNWAEADGDVAEAIDFCEFYAREMIRLSGPQPLTPSLGEENELQYIPLGVGLVVPPWNFPLAILVGMTTAAIVAGNTVILKPSSETPGIAYQFYKVMEETGLPKGVLNFLPGPGSSVGDHLVQNAKTRFIAFTGSKEVGLRINELAAKPQKGQLWIKRVIAEMGGKDSIVVDDSADIDSAVDGIVASAFGFQGQKCSACSRAIIHANVYDEVLKKVVEKTKKLQLGSPEKKETNMGPVASKSQYASVKEYIEIGSKEGKLETGGGAGSFATDGKDGFYIEPTIISGIDPMARISQEEIFGPVLAFIKAKDWSDALKIANNTEFGLTGAVYSGNRDNLEQARREFHVGNLYINRKCTGALVGVHPFGGFNMSGTDSKAGGRDYLLLFTQAKSIAEKY
ncbi:MAG: L-glutamate gamma-semialdehyde dehydrogenase [Candidatus Melainabacteria bacterium]|nr:MAG: L-glutamate gamma-semialdehyde dehydrogenase [Candidatus Melainabacteria bacterium]